MNSSVVYALSELIPEGEPPTEIRLFRAGINKTTKGDLLFDDVAANAIMEAYASSPTYPDLMMDFGHASLNPKRPEDNESGAWYQVELRNGPEGPELFLTNIRWVDDVADKIKSGKYRFYSPAVTVSKDEPKRPIRLINCALTNLPATIGLIPLMASELENNSMLPKLAEMLGMDPSACTEEDVMSALSTVMKSYADMKGRMEAPTADPMKCSEVDELIVLSGIADKADWKGALVVLSNEVKTLRVEKQTAKVAGLVEDAIKARKLTPAQRDSYTKLGMRDIEMLSELIANTAPVLPEPSNQPKNKTVMLSDSEIEICRVMGVDPAAYLETKQNSQKVK